MNTKQLVILLFLLAVPSAIAANIDTAEQFRQKYPEALEFLRTLPKDYFVFTPAVLTWVDTGQAIENLTDLKVVAKYPSQKLIDSYVNYSGLLEDEEKIEDISTFFMTSDENISLYIANKYNVSYVFITFETWLYNQREMQSIVKDCGYSRTGNNTCQGFHRIEILSDPDSFIQRQNFSNYTVLRYSDRAFYIGPKELNDSVIIRMLFRSGSFNNPNSELIYNDSLELIYSDSEVKIYKVKRFPWVFVVAAVLSIVLVSLISIFIYNRKSRKRSR